ncbi:MAG: FAD-dependent oxidoreductase [Magnetococcales bacterium]|nr:FAD-dependent oxidoreductase [Magnetococcales bacterium]
MNPICIVGTGLAGYTLAKELRRQKYPGSLVLITADEGRYYSKPLLSTALAQNKDTAALTLATAEQMSSELQAEIKTGSPVTAIDPQQHTVTLGGTNLTYDKLVLAIGSAPIRLPLTGDGAQDVLSVNNLDDYGHFRQRVQQARRVAIIGPGLIGCEFANDLLQSGREVLIIGPDRWPISSLLPEQAGRAVQQALASHGAIWHLETVNGPIEKTGTGYRTVLKNGDTVTADLILSAVGVRPVTAMAQQAGLQVERGIVTDGYLRTSAADVFALGDCAAVNGRHLPFIAPLMAGAKALAATLCGQETAVTYPVMPIAIKTTLYPIITLPPATAEGHWEMEQSDSGVTGRHFNAQHTLDGFVLTGQATTNKSAFIKEFNQ